MTALGGNQLGRSMREPAGLLEAFCLDLGEDYTGVYMYESTELSF